MNLDGIIEDYPNVETPLNKATFTNLTNAILDKICPIGKTEIFYDNEDHSDYLGFMWERTSVGRAIVGIDETQEEFNEIGKKHGSKTHTLTVAQMPNHSHEIRLGIAEGIPTGMYASYVQNGRLAYNTIENRGTTPTGGGEAHNNLQPYEVFAIWKRVA